MKINILIFALIIVLPWKSQGQGIDCSHQFIDSVNVRYRALERDDLIDITLRLNRHTLSIDKVLNTPHYASEIKQIHQTHCTDTIDYLFDCIRIIINTPPIYDSDYVVFDCCDEMSLSVFVGDIVSEFSYIHYRDAYFPFAYAELYSFICHFLAKYRKIE